MTITLYHAPGACSIATYVSLLEAGADFDVELISLAKKSKRQIATKRSIPSKRFRIWSSMERA